jgi:IMP dehydrogenase/GMP reductase
MESIGDIPVPKIIEGQYYVVECLSMSLFKVHVDPVITLSRPQFSAVFCTVKEDRKYKIKDFLNE